MEGKQGLQGHEASGPVYHDEARSEDAGHRRWLGLWDRHAGWQESNFSRQDRIVYEVPSGSEIRSIVWVAEALTQTEPLGGLREPGVCSSILEPCQESARPSLNLWARQGQTSLDNSPSLLKFK